MIIKKDKRITRKLSAIDKGGKLRKENINKNKATAALNLQLIKDMAFWPFSHHFVQTSQSTTHLHKPNFPFPFTIHTNNNKAKRRGSLWFSTRLPVTTPNYEAIEKKQKKERLNFKPSHTTITKTSSLP